MFWFPQPRTTDDAVPARHIGIALGEFSTGGSERVALRLANRWSALGRRVTIFSGNADGPVRDLVDPSVHVSPVRLDRPVSKKVLGQRMARSVVEARPDVIVGPGNSHLPILSGMLGAIRGGRPAVVCKLSNPLHREERSRIGEAIFVRGLRRRTAGIDRIVAMSPTLAAEAATMLRRADIACVPEPTLDDGYVPLRRLSPSGLVLCIGRLTRQKDFGLALEAFARMRGDRRLAILGEGEDYGQLREQAEKLGVADRVRFVGYVADVQPWLTVADALLCTSRFEGYPAAVIEALAGGLPVITTPCSPALPEIMLDRSFGTIVPPRASALAEAAEEVLDEERQPDPRLLSGLIARHSIQSSATAWLALLDEAVVRREPGMFANTPLEPALRAAIAA